MIVHFIASANKLGSDIEKYREIISIIKHLGHKLSRDWLEDGFLNYERAKRDKLDWYEIVDGNNEALSTADVVIAEATTKSFSVGYQVANAIRQKLPVLILTSNDSLRGSFASGLDANFVVNKTYTEENLRNIISDFLFDNNINNRDMRFNLFINKRIYNYLRWMSYKTHKSKSEILREIVEKEITTPAD